jgi:hypothetical protein
MQVPRRAWRQCQSADGQCESVRAPGGQHMMSGVRVVVVRAPEESGPRRYHSDATSGHDYTVRLVFAHEEQHNNNKTTTTMHVGRASAGKRWPS